MIMFILFQNWRVSLVFLCGVLLSPLARYIGMNVAVRANVRAADAATKSSAATFRISFLGGTVTGLLVTGISLLGLYVLRLIISGLLAIAVPIAVGLLFGTVPLGTLLIGATASSAMIGFFFNNSEALLDNAKKLNENGFCGIKGSESYKASVVGDTVGNALKDVADPSVLILMKLLGMTALLLLPVLLYI